MERTKLGLSKDKMYKALGDGERTSKKVASIRMSDGSTFKRKNANQYGAAESGNDYTEKRSNRTDRFDLGGTADSSNTGANMGGTMGSSIMKDGGAIGETLKDLTTLNAIGKKYSLSFDKKYKYYTGNPYKNSKGETLPNFFIYKDRIFELKYYSGSFNPYLIELNPKSLVYEKSTNEPAFKNYSNPKWNKEKYYTKEEMKTGGNLIGKQDFKMIRGNKKANGGGLADLPENPNNDAISYKDGGSVKSIEYLENKLNSAEKRYNKAIQQEKVGIISTQELNKFKNNVEKARENVNQWYSTRPIKHTKGSMANGGGLANTPESFPNNDAMSYKTGGKVIKSKQKLTGDDLDTYNFFIREGDTEEQAMQGVLNARKDRKEHKENESFYKRGYEHAQGGSTKGFEYTIGGL